MKNGEEKRDFRSQLSVLHNGGVYPPAQRACHLTDKRLLAIPVCIYPPAAVFRRGLRLYIFKRSEAVFEKQAGKAERIL